MKNPMYLGKKDLNVCKAPIKPFYVHREYFAKLPLYVQSPSGFMKPPMYRDFVRPALYRDFVKKLPYL